MIRHINRSRSTRFMSLLLTITTLFSMGLTVPVNADTVDGEPVEEIIVEETQVETTESDATVEEIVEVDNVPDDSEVVYLDSCIDDFSVLANEVVVEEDTENSEDYYETNSVWIVDNPTNNNNLYSASAIRGGNYRICIECYQNYTSAKYVTEVHYGSTSGTIVAYNTSYKTISGSSSHFNYYLYWDTTGCSAGYYYVVVKQYNYISGSYSTSPYTSNTLRINLIAPTNTPTPTPVIVANPDSSRVDMQRLYNPSSGEHFYTGNIAETYNLIGAGWRYEGVGWVAPKTGTPVYRLYNPYTGDHHYTVNTSERAVLINAGWRYEGIGWYSAPSSSGRPLYRLYNPYCTGAGSHHYTLSTAEVSSLQSRGWRYEGISWYGLA